MNMAEGSAGVRQALSDTAHHTGVLAARAAHGAGQAAAPALDAVATGAERTRTAARRAAHTASDLAERTGGAVSGTVRSGRRRATRAARRRAGRRRAVVGLILATGAVAAVGWWAARRRGEDFPDWLDEQPFATDAEEGSAVVGFERVRAHDEAADLSPLKDDVYVVDDVDGKNTEVADHVRDGRRKG
ncbi:hypothetical protein ACIQ9P_22040 [Kitasatospora sp. NPDC094019]|uniref:hypothetical protein n=1 Tax=Kitasatospora sp. NPDC094019 TaxID=3364091 RepID=UPI003812B60E